MQATIKHILKVWVICLIVLMHEKADAQLVIITPEIIYDHCVEPASGNYQEQAAGNKKLTEHNLSLDKNPKDFIQNQVLLFYYFRKQYLCGGS
jgi:hypothetical protein